MIYKVLFFSVLYSLVVGRAREREERVYCVGWIFFCSGWYLVIYSGRRVYLGIVIGIYVLIFYFKFSGNLKGFFFGKWCIFYNFDIFKVLNNVSIIFFYICCICIVYELL